MVRRSRSSGLEILLYLVFLGLIVQGVQRYWPLLLGAGILLVALLAWQRAARRRRLRGLSLHDLDALSGKDFEAWITTVLAGEGFDCENIRHSGDFGIDVIAARNGVRIGIQAKRYSGSVGNDAVQQAVSGCDYHGCQVAAVVTQSRFTRAARAQAERSRIPVLLVDRNRLAGMGRLFRKVVGG